MDSLASTPPFLGIEYWPVNGEKTRSPICYKNPPCILASGHVKLDSALKRMWRNWYTRTFEGRVALPYEFESRHPHFLIKYETRPIFLFKDCDRACFYFLSPLLPVIVSPLIKITAMRPSSVVFRMIFCIEQLKNVE